MEEAYVGKEKVIILEANPTSGEYLVQFPDGTTEWITQYLVTDQPEED